MVINSNNNCQIFDDEIANIMCEVVFKEDTEPCNLINDENTKNTCFYNYLFIKAMQTKNSKYCQNIAIYEGKDNELLCLNYALDILFFHFLIYVQLSARLVYQPWLYFELLES